MPQRKSLLLEVEILISNTMSAYHPRVWMRTLSGDNGLRLLEVEK